VIIFDKFGDGQAERSRSVPVFPDNPIRIVTPVSPLPLLPLTKERAKGGCPLQMEEEPSDSTFAPPPESLKGGRMAVPPRETRIAGRGTRLPATFLPGSAQHVECDVTRTKQTTGEFLPGARTACQRSAFRHGFFRSSEFLTETASHSEIDVTPSKQTTGEFLTETRIVPLPGFSRAFFAKNSVRSTRFLTGSASQTEFVVTRSKQTTDEFLTGARTAISVSQFRAEFRSESQAQGEKECRSRHAAEQSKILLHIRNEKELL
jgi:hypothetical protein